MSSKESPFYQLELASRKSGYSFYQKQDWGLFNFSPGSYEVKLQKESFLILINKAKKKATYKSSFIPMWIDLDPFQYQVLAYPRSEWNLEIESEEGDGIHILAMTLEWMHQIIGSAYSSKNEGESKFSLPKTPLELTPGLEICMHQLFSEEHASVGSILLKESKILEFLALMLKDLNGEKPEIGACPFLEDEDEVLKIKEAREILVRELDQPNSIRDLARRIGTNEYKLKTGFKHIYGQTVHAYLVEQRLEKGRLLLLKSRKSVSEVANQVGFSNSSHFISAFRKKFGITPKKVA